jgi:hypothetical protein
LSFLVGRIQQNFLTQPSDVGQVHDRVDCTLQDKCVSLLSAGLGNITNKSATAILYSLQVMLSGNLSINIDANDVYNMDPLLYKISVEMPADVLPFWDQETGALQQEQQDIIEQMGLEEFTTDHMIQVRAAHVAVEKAVNLVDWSHAFVRLCLLRESRSSLQKPCLV